MRSAWRAAVGKIISRHTSRVRLVRTTLVVDVEDAIWQRQLNSLRRQILDQVRKVTGNTALESLEFRIAVPRRQPQRALSANEAVAPAQGESFLTQPLPNVARAARDGQSTLWSSGPDADEADRIQDPVLKKVYRLSRRKAMA